MSRVLNFFQFFPPSPPLLAPSEAETTFNELSNAKSLQNICCNRCSQSKDYSSFGRSAIASTFALSLSLEYWKVGRGGELLWFASGGGDNQPILSLFFFFFSLPSKAACIPNQRGRCGEKANVSIEGSTTSRRWGNASCFVQQPRPNHRFTHHSLPFLTFRGNPTELKIPGKPLLSCEFLMVGIENNFPSASELSQRGPRPSLFTRIAR